MPSRRRRQIFHEMFWYQNVAAFKTFFSNGNNKERMSEFMQEVRGENGAEIGDSIIYVAWRGNWRRLSGDGNCNVAGLITDHEEAHTKTVYPTIQSTPKMSVVVQGGHCMRCEVIFRRYWHSSNHPCNIFNLHVLVDNGTGKNRKFLNLIKYDLTGIQRKWWLGVLYGSKRQATVGKIKRAI